MISMTTTHPPETETLPITATGDVPSYAWLARLRAHVLVGDVPYAHQLARDPAVPADVLAELAKNVDRRVAQALASHTNTPRATLLALHEQHGVGYEHPLLAKLTDDPDVLSDLASGSAVSVQLAVILNPHTPETAFAKLGDPTKHTAALFGDRRTPLAIYERLAAHDVSFAMVFKTLPTQRQARTYFTPMRNGTTLQNLARLRRGHPLDSDWFVEHYAGDHGLLELFIAHVSCPDDVLLEHYTKRCHLSAIASNPGCPTDWLDTLGRGTHKAQVHTAVVQHPNTPVETLEVLARTTTSLRVRRAFAVSRRSSPELLGKLARCAGKANAPIRSGIANNPNTPEVVLRALSSDRHPGVARAAYTHLQRITTPDPTAGSALEAKLRYIGRKSISSAGLPDLPQEAVENMMALADDWTGTLSEIIDAATLLAAQKTGR